MTGTRDVIFARVLRTPSIVAVKKIVNIGVIARTT
jgi:hypothetical protein